MKKLLFTCIALSSIYVADAQNMSALQISTTSAETWHVYPQKVSSSDNNVRQRIKFTSSDVNSTFRSFGTCFNELDWYALQLLPQAEQDRFFRNVFHPDGDLKFTLGRIPMGASDYAAPEDFYTRLYHERNEGIDLQRSWYSPDEMPKGETDINMEHFTLARDRKAIIPFIKRAQEENPDLDFWCSPWSPPQWMKKSEHYSNRAGYGNGLDVTYPRYTTQFKMEDDILQAHARYFGRFIEEYQKEGIDITGCCYQNEAYTVNYYPNTSWSATDAGRFNADYLVPYLKEHHPNVKVWLGTLNTNDLNNIREILNYQSTHPQYQGKRLSEMLDGAGFQWEGRDAIATIRKEYPRLEMIQTESECGGGTFDWGAGVHTFELIHHYLSHGCVDYTNWNSILGGNGRGPFMNWHQNALVHINEALPRQNGTCTATYTPEYYAYKHYSHFIESGTKILNKADNKPLLLVAQRPDGLYIAVVGNESTYERSLQLDIDGHCLDVCVPAQSMNTFVLGEKEAIDRLAVTEGMIEGAEPYVPQQTHQVFIDASQKYYLYNIKEGKYLNAGGRYGSRPVLDNVGCEYTFEYSDNGDIYYLRTPYGSNTYLGWMDLKNGLSIEQQYFMDNTKAKEPLTFFPTSQENVYAIGMFGHYLTFKPELSIGTLNAGELGWGPEIQEDDDVEQNDAVLWKLVTREERMAQAREATQEHPADVTFAVFNNPHFNRYSAQPDEWNEPLSLLGLTKDPYREYAVGLSSDEIVDRYLDVDNMQAGVYVFSAQGYYRNGVVPSITDENRQAYIYAMSSDSDIASEALPAWAAGAVEGKIGQGTETEVNDKAGWYVPADAAACQHYFNAEAYSRSSAMTVVKDGKLRLGFKNVSATTGDEMVFDNLRVLYYPHDTDVNMKDYYLSALADSIAGARSLLQASTDVSGKKAFESAIQAAEQVYNDQPAWHVAQQAIFTLHQAHQKYLEAQGSGSIKDKIDANGGNASFLLPKITQWQVEAVRSVINETTQENWDGIANSTVGLVKVYSGSISTTLSGLPAGKYRMVASVRGVKGNTLTPSINGVTPGKVRLVGWNLAEAEGNAVINMNGVEMPANSQAIGYNQAPYSQGWCWVAAETELSEAGDVTLSLSSQEGEFQVTNVFLYELSNENVIAFDENIDLANAHKTVMADIRVNNPNQIVSSEAPITTAAGVEMNNNLVDGVVRKLILSDEFSCEYDAGFQAGEVSVIHPVEAGLWQLLCLPFDLSQEDVQRLQITDIGVFTRSMSNNKLLFKRVTSMQAGVPYLVKLSAAQSVFEKDYCDIVSQPASLTSTDETATLTGCFSATSIPAGVYKLQHDSFALTSVESLVTGFSAFLANEGASQSQQPSFTISFDADETTVLDDVKKVEKAMSEVYTIDGVKMPQREDGILKNGVYVIDRKKVLLNRQ